MLKQYQSSNASFNCKEFQKIFYKPEWRIMPCCNSFYSVKDFNFFRIEHAIGQARNKRF